MMQLSWRHKPCGFFFTCLLLCIAIAYAAHTESSSDSGSHSGPAGETSQTGTLHDHDPVQTIGQRRGREELEDASNEERPTSRQTVTTGTQTPVTQAGLARTFDALTPHVSEAVARYSAAYAHAVNDAKFRDTLSTCIRDVASQVLAEDLALQQNLYFREHKPESHHVDSYERDTAGLIRGADPITKRLFVRDIDRHWQLDAYRLAELHEGCDAVWDGILTAADHHYGYFEMRPFEECMTALRVAQLWIAIRYPVQPDLPAVELRKMIIDPRDHKSRLGLERPHNLQLPGPRFRFLRAKNNGNTRKWPELLGPRKAAREYFASVAGLTLDDPAVAQRRADWKRNGSPSNLRQPLHPDAQAVREMFDA